jgi:3-isopropylmalate/(R)-2-methylmalate dehydratase large subunit
VSTIELPGRILFLSSDPDKIQAQLHGQVLTLQSAAPLRDDVSTDEIIPMTAMSYYDERLGHFPYTGFRAGGRNPIGKDAIKSRHFSVTVGGKRYGKGSSREHSVSAEKLAGIRLVIAESFERIYRQNADNVGLFTSTDFGLIERIQRGEPIDVEEVIASRDALSAAVIRAGGLLRYGSTRMRHVSVARTAEPSERPRTLAHKILARHVVRTDDTDGGLEPGQGAFVRADWRFIIEVYTGMATHMMHATFGKPVQLVEPLSILGFAEHFSHIHKSPSHIAGNLVAQVHRVHDAHQQFVADYGIRNHGFLDGQDGSEGICHPMMIERYALPGQVVVGTDSHTPHAGALGCLAFGVGTTEMANAMLTGAVRITVPPTLRVDFNGELPTGLTGKDLVLHLLAHPKVRSGGGVGKVFEFTGPVIAKLSIDERTTLTNMAAELGGFTGLVAPDAETVHFLRERRGVDFVIEPWMRSDEGADYADVISIDCTALSPMVAAPGDPGNGIALNELTQRVKVDIAFAGTCTGGKREDFDHYHHVLAWGVEHGLKVPAGVTLVLQFGTGAVRDYCAERGYLETFEKVGATLLQPSCGACANMGPGSSTRADQVTVSAQNRNFPGRSGPGQIWLASPPTVVASALAGELISFERLRERVLAAVPG